MAPGGNPVRCDGFLAVGDFGHGITLGSACAEIRCKHPTLRIGCGASHPEHLSSDFRVDRAACRRPGDLPVRATGPGAWTGEARPWTAFRHRRWAAGDPAALFRFAVDGI